jgi:hypothetical protein
MMELVKAEKIVRDMAEQRGVRPHVIITEYLKYRDAITNACAHFWPDQNDACFKMTTVLEELRTA